MAEKKILYLVDNINYIKENCFQSQLYNAMRYTCQVHPLEVYPAITWPFKHLYLRLDSYDKVISVLRLRTLNKVWPRLKSFLNGVPLTIYDQDPWEAFIDSSPIKGFYHTLNEQLNLASIYVTAPWWANKLKSNGFPADFVRMGMEPKWCNPGIDFESRKILLGFRGALHDHRKIIFEKFRSAGLDVKIESGRLDYAGYMEYLQNLKFFAHDESALPWICDGESISRSTGMWIKSIETASRGTFCLRDYHVEGEAYNLSNMPLIRCYKTPEDAAGIVDEILSMNKNLRREMQIETVNKIRTQYDWLETAHKLSL